MIAITSIQNQQVRLFLMKESGRLVEVYSFGETLRSDDMLERLKVDQQEREYRARTAGTNYQCDCPTIDMLGTGQMTHVPSGVDAEDPLLDSDSGSSNEPDDAPMVYLTQQSR
jgi:hypothetical protein